MEAQVHHSLPNTLSLPKQRKAVVQLATYRCPTRFLHHGVSGPTAAPAIQLKARNATEAFRLAILVAPPGVLVVDVERLDG
jgi:hypothetical protein